jgi:hypothetical protein
VSARYADEVGRTAVAGLLRVARRADKDGRSWPVQLLRSLVPGASFRRYRDGCVAVVVGRRRGPCAHSRPMALHRFLRSGLIARASSGS